MVDSRPSSTDEKATVVDDSKSKGFFSRKKSAKAEDITNEKTHEDDESSTDVKPAVREVPPISFTELFR